MDQYEEDRRIGPVQGWALLVVFCAAIIGWGVFNWAMIPDRPRDWHYGPSSDAPGASVYSSVAAPDSAHPPRQFAPLPEATNANDAAAPGTTRPATMPFVEQAGGRP
jgi:hypothetical protein